ncbi:hypothetical protein [Paracoccus rhizosphaerae]|uniref:Uncharacterized protein n=1 Tax=Paracoccus rhizosphaerae TaxID=1133347 RepID=A0ABV6CL89_9RHOB|nr:hypothetical protein [Paracoccus rhizosphaerae]
MSARDDLLAIPDEVLRSGRIGQAALVFMDFRDAPKCWWTGFGDLDAAGHRWQGLGDLISVSPISTSYQVSAQKLTFQLAATQEMIALALDARHRVRDRTVTVYLQMFAMDGQAVGGVENGQPLGSPLSLFNGAMQKIAWAAEGSTSRQLTLDCKGVFFRRNSAPRGRWTDSDQKARHPGDRGFERTPLYANNYQAPWRR